jgi:hypothetical protein
MATTHEEIRVEVSAERVWDAVRDVGALHTRLVPGFVTDTRMQGETRVVTFGNGMVVLEPIISIDDERRRLAWAAVGGSTTHYNAVLHVVPDGDGCFVRWTSDVLPHSVAPTIAGMQRQGLAVLKKTLES